MRSPTADRTARQIQSDDFKFYLKIGGFFHHSGLPSALVAGRREYTVSEFQALVRRMDVTQLAQYLTGKIYFSVYCVCTPLLQQSLAAWRRLQ